MDEEDLDTLTADFSRLRSSIAAELRRVAPTQEKPEKAFSSVLADNMPPLPNKPQPVVRPPPVPPSAPSGEAKAIFDDDEVPQFYSLRENLLGKVSSSGGAAPPPKSVPIRTPQEHANTVNISKPPPDVDTTPRAS